MPTATKIINPIVQKLAEVDTTGWDNRLQPYLHCYRVLKAVNADGAKRFLIGTKIILNEMLSKIESQEIQQVMIENIPEHRELTALISQM